MPVVVSITTLDLDNVASTTISEADGDDHVTPYHSPEPISQDLQVDLSSTGMTNRVSYACETTAL